MTAVAAHPRVGTGKVFAMATLALAFANQERCDAVVFFAPPVIVDHVGVVILAVVSHAMRKNGVAFAAADIDITAFKVLAMTALAHRDTICERCHAVVFFFLPQRIGKCLIPDLKITAFHAVRKNGVTLVAGHAGQAALEVCAVALARAFGLPVRQDILAMVGFVAPVVLMREDGVTGFAAGRPSTLVGARLCGFALMTAQARVHADREHLQTVECGIAPVFGMRKNRVSVRRQVRAELRIIQELRRIACRGAAPQQEGQKQKQERGQDADQTMQFIRLQRWL